MSSETITRNDLANILNEIVAIDGTDMTAQQISDFVDSLNVTGINAVDYVVDEGGGSDSLSTYKWRTWNSGKAEFWYSIANTGGLTTTVWSSPIAYGDSGSWSSIWSGIFNAKPSYVLLTPNRSNIISVYPYAWDENGIISLRFLTVGAGSNAGYAFSLYAVGTWK